MIKNLQYDLSETKIAGQTETKPMSQTNVGMTLHWFGS